MFELDDWRLVVIAFVVGWLLPVAAADTSVEVMTGFSIFIKVAVEFAAMVVVEVVLEIVADVVEVDVSVRLLAVVIEGNLDMNVVAVFSFAVAEVIGVLVEFFSSSIGTVVFEVELTDFTIPVIYVINGVVDSTKLVISARVLFVSIAVALDESDTVADRVDD